VSIEGLDDGRVAERGCGHYEYFMALNESLRMELSELLAKSRIVLFMKGSRRMPQCGFSAQVVKILDELAATYETVDVLRSPELRDGIKEFSQWPTIPQLYVAGQFVGGCDIVRELFASGELQKLIGADAAGVEAPTVSMTDAAAKAFQKYVAEGGGDSLRLQIGPEFDHALFLGPGEPGDILVQANSIALALDPSSARRANGVSIDFIEGPEGGFKIRNPNEPPRVKALAPVDLKAMLEGGERIELVDVRSPEERAIARLDRARSLDDGGSAYLASLDRDAPIVFHCHHGIRSRAAAERAVQEGFRNVYNLEGGIDAWSRTVDPSVRRY
jgi:monothiol glutaredoxin